MSTDASNPQEDRTAEPEGTIPNTQDGVGMGAGGEASTFEPEETPEAAPEDTGHSDSGSDRSSGSGSSSSSESGTDDLNDGRPAPVAHEERSPDLGAPEQASAEDASADPESVEVPAAGEPTGPAAEKDREEPDDRGLTTDTSSSE
jgi:hypothetical protein